MTDYSKDIALMFPATVEGGSEPNVETHVTALYLGDVDSVSFTSEQLIIALEPYGALEVGEVFPRELKLFGENKDYLVVTFEDYHLDIIHSLVLNVVKQLGGGNASNFKDFSPHMTLQDEYSGQLDTEELPSKVVLAPLQLWWGNDKIDLVKD